MILTPLFALENLTLQHRQQKPYTIHKTRFSYAKTLHYNNTSIFLREITKPYTTMPLTSFTRKPYTATTHKNLTLYSGAFMTRQRRTASNMYPKLQTLAEAIKYYEAVPTMRGRNASHVKPLARGKRTAYPWTIEPHQGGISCSHCLIPAIIYHATGWVQILPKSGASQFVAVVRAVAPVDTIRWDYRKAQLEVYVKGQRHACSADSSRGIWLPPDDLEWV